MAKRTLYIAYPNKNRTKWEKFCCLCKRLLFGKEGSLESFAHFEEFDTFYVYKQNSMIYNGLKGVCKMLKRNYSGGISKKWLNWNRFWQVLAVVYFVALFFGFRTARAFDGDYGDYFTTEHDGLSITVVSVEQNGVSLSPVWDDELDEYYFVAPTNSDMFRVGVVVNGASDSETYRDNHYNIINVANGEVFYEEMRARANFPDCGEYCSVWDNQYILEPSLSPQSGVGVQKNLIVRPTAIGNQFVEIVSVKQNGTELALVDNEFQITDYSTPVSVTYKLKNLVVGRRYSVDLGYNDYYSFEAEATEVTTTRELPLDYARKHLSFPISLYGTGVGYDYDNRVELYFRISDTHFVELGDVVIDSVEQSGTAITPTTTQEWRTTYTFRANDVQPITIRLHALAATADMNYYITYNMYGDGASINSQTATRVTGSELINGAVLTIPSGYGLSESSPMELNLSINTVGSNNHNTTYVTYQEDSSYASIKVNYYEDNTLPRYDASLSYTGEGELPGIMTAVINAKYHNAEHPLAVTVMGERYDSSRNYTIRASVSNSNGEEIFEDTYMATGAELNAGKSIVLNGLELSLPVFDPTGSSSGYELWYDFTLEVDGLTQSGSMYYMYDGYITTVMTYPGGKVATMGDGGGMGGGMYMTSSVAVLRRSSIDGSRTATLNYVANGFDDDLSYQYTIYYNPDAGDTLWQASAGRVVESGTMRGSDLNANGLSVDVSVPDGAVDNTMYTLVITRNGGLVIASKDFLSFEDSPRLESFALRADEESFMQTNRVSYRLARGTDATAVLTGAGFDANENYKLWVTYSGYEHYECEYSETGCWREPDMSAVNYEATVTGAQLNNGINYTMAYNEVFDGVDELEVYFDITGTNASRPRHGGMGSSQSVMDADNRVYAGHVISIEYVADEDVFRGEGFQIDEDTSAFIDKSTPDEPRLPIDDKTPGDVGYHVEDGNTLVLVSSKPTLVIGLKDGHYQLIELTSTIDDDGMKTNRYGIEGFEEIKLVLKGDGTMDGAVTSADLNKITRSLVGSSLLAHRDLSELEQIILDVTGDNQVTSADTNRITRSLIGNSLPAYRALEW